MRLLILVGLLMLVACSTKGDLYWGWQCDGGANTPEWDCTQRLLRDGRPVDMTELDEADIPPMPATLDEPGTLAQEPRSAEQKVPALAEAEQSDWRQQLPNLDGSLPGPPKRAEPYRSPINNLDKAAKKSQRPVPEPEPYRLPTGQKQPVAPEPEPVRDPDQVVVTARAEATANRPVLEHKKGYTLQLAALDTQREVKQFIARFQLQGKPLVRTHTQSRNKTWYVLTTGLFANRAAAERAGQELSSSYPGLAYWVRSLQSLRAVAIDEGLQIPGQ